MKRRAMQPLRRAGAAVSAVVKRATLVGLLAAIAVPAATAWAQAPPPSLPEGFVAASSKLGKPTVRKTGHGPMQRDHEVTFSTRSPVPGTNTDVASIAGIEVDPDTFEDVAPAAPARITAANPGDLIVFKTGSAPRLSVQGYEAGILRLGTANPVATGRQSSGGAAQACGPRAAGGGGVKPVSYEAIKRIDAHGGLELVMARGAFDAASCAISITHRATVRPTHIAGGIVYAFRAHCARCELGKRDALHVVIPQTQANKFEFFIPFEHHRLTLAPGVSAAFIGTTGPISSSFNEWGLPAWDGVVKRECEHDKTFCFTDVRFEVSWARGEPAPTAFVAGEFMLPAPPQHGDR